MAMLKMLDVAWLWLSADLNVDLRQQANRIDRASLNDSVRSNRAANRPSRVCRARLKASENGSPLVIWMLAIMSMIEANRVSHRDILKRPRTWY